ncbi:MAG: hypothetical protein KVP17_000697 [Porospora cf. gigantea B]|uniref:uncharacterized protein n=1 Tax=Porospora cf. gigantea B TaxID=2853592 RepID=UPI003571D1FE|nr:MAG: hypothetical protein KVP17_000697 [Porospora cf. gigantea B]
MSADEFDLAKERARAVRERYGMRVEPPGVAERVASRARFLFAWVWQLLATCLLVLQLFFRSFTGSPTGPSNRRPRDAKQTFRCDTVQGGG